MGISGLLPFLQESSKKCHVSEFRGCTVAIDSYCWLHKGAFGCADKLIRGEDTLIYVQYCLKYINLLLSYCIKPILVFDGQRLPAKKETEKKRSEQRKLARLRGTELLRLGKPEEARQYFRQCLDINHKMALALIKECRNRNIDCIVAPYEADAQLTFLNLRGIADVVITEDSDLILFGCHKIFFKFSLDGCGFLVEQSKLHLSMKIKSEEYTFDKFRYMCILSGCDYLDSLPGIGLKKAHKAVTMTHDPNIYNLLPRLPRYLNIKKLVVPPEYLENFKLADATIKHQVVYDPIERQLTRLTDPKKCDTKEEYLKNSGQISNADTAFQMALGNIDPISLIVMDDWNPDVDPCSLPSNSIWSNKFKNSKVDSNIVNIKIRKRLTSTPCSNDTSVEVKQKEYDDNLVTELKMYQSVTPVKEATNNDQINHISDKTDVEKINPFVKAKRISKFKLTNIESEECTTSLFFSSKPVNLENDFQVTQKRKLEDVSDEIDLTLDADKSPVLPLTSRTTVNIKRFAHNSCKKNLSKSINDITNLSETESKEASNLKHSIQVEKVSSKAEKSYQTIFRKKKKLTNQPTLLNMFSKMKATSIV